VERYPHPLRRRRQLRQRRDWAFVAPASSVGLGTGIAAVSADNIWAIIGGEAQQWDGTSWSQIANPSKVNELIAVTALSDGAVVAVGTGTNNSAVIVSNVRSGGAAAIPAGPTLFAAPLPAVEATIAAPTPKMPAPLESAAVDQLFVVDGKADQSLAAASRSFEVHEAADLTSSLEASGLFFLV
jgi:hypothetical protein